MDPGKGIKVLRIKYFNLLVTFISKQPTGKKLGQEQISDYKNLSNYRE